MKEKLIELLWVEIGDIGRSDPRLPKIADEILELFSLEDRGWRKFYANNKFIGWFMPAEVNWIGEARERETD